MKRVPFSLGNNLLGNLPILCLLIGVLLGVILLAYGPFVGEREGEPTDLRPVEFGEGYEYQPQTLRRFAKLMESPDWSVTSPPRNAQGMATAVHRLTGLVFVLIPAGEFPIGPEPRGFYSDQDNLLSVTVEEPVLLCDSECTPDAWAMGGGSESSFEAHGDFRAGAVSLRAFNDWCVRNGMQVQPGNNTSESGVSTMVLFGDRVEPTLSQLAEQRWNRRSEGETTRLQLPGRYLLRLWTGPDRRVSVLGFRPAADLPEVK